MSTRGVAARSEETFSVSEGDCDDRTATTTTQCVTEEKTTSCFSGSDVAIWVAALALVILFTIGLWYGMSCLSSCDDEGKGKKGKGGSYGNGMGILGGVLIWLIVVIIFICAVATCGWGAIVAFIIILVIIAAIAFFASYCGGCDNSSNRRSDL